MPLYTIKMLVLPEPVTIALEHLTATFDHQKNVCPRSGGKWFVFT